MFAAQFDYVRAKTLDDAWALLTSMFAFDTTTVATQGLVVAAAVILLLKPDSQTIPVGLTQFRSQFQVELGPQRFGRRVGGARADTDGRCDRVREEQGDRLLPAEHEPMGAGLRLIERDVVLGDRHPELRRESGDEVRDLLPTQPRAAAATT